MPHTYKDELKENLLKVMAEISHYAEEHLMDGEFLNHMGIKKLRPKYLALVEHLREKKKEKEKVANRNSGREK